MDKQELLELKENIDKAKDEVNKLEGRREGLLEKLKEEWDCDSVEEVEELLDEMDEKIEELETEIKEGTEKLEEEYELG